MLFFQIGFDFFCGENLFFRQFVSALPEKVTTKMRQVSERKCAKFPNENAPSFRIAVDFFSFIIYNNLEKENALCHIKKE